MFLIPRLEGRILTGIVTFVVIMILIGWVAINEPGRMAAFERQHNGRSIERGAELFASNCSTCHGNAGEGQVNRAPGLNNPHLFGYDPFGTIFGELAGSDALIGGLEAEREALIAELAEGVDAERQQEITTRVGEIDASLAEAQEERAILVEERDSFLLQLEPAFNNGYIPGILDLDPTSEDYDAELDALISSNTERLSQVAWGGDLNGYVVTTLIHGRPGSNEVWPEPMSAWSQTAGGPLREDQIQDIANYILNWDEGDNWTSDDLLAIPQFAKVYVDSSLVGGDVAGVESVGTDVLAILDDAGTLEGDATRGEALYTGSERTQLRQRLGCSGCHAGAVQAPDTIGTWDRVVNERLADPAFEGYTPEQYIVESIVQPDAYVVDTYSSGVMPGVYGEQLSSQDLADIMAYLRVAGAEEEQE